MKEDEEDTWARGLLADEYQRLGMPRNGELIRAGADPFLGTDAGLAAIKRARREALEGGK